MAEGIVERRECSLVISTHLRETAQARVPEAQSPRTSEYDVLFRKRKRGVRFDTPRRGGEAGPGPGVARKTKNLGVSTRRADQWIPGQLHRYLDACLESC